MAGETRTTLGAVLKERYPDSPRRRKKARRSRIVRELLRRGTAQGLTSPKERNG